MRIPAAHRKLGILHLYFFKFVNPRWRPHLVRRTGESEGIQAERRKYERSNSAQLVWNRQHKQIYLSLTIFKSWKDAKNEAGYGSSTDSEFAAHLLSLEYRRRCEEFHYFTFASQ